MLPLILRSDYLLRPEVYDGTSLNIRRAAWRKYVGKPKGKRGCGTEPLIPTAATILDEYLATASPKKFIFETWRGDPADLDYLVREMTRPKLKEHGLPWYGLHAFRRGLATNLHALGIADIVIQAILRHSDVSVTRLAYIKNDGVDSRSLAANGGLGFGRMQLTCNRDGTRQKRECCKLMNASRFETAEGCVSG